MAEIAFDTLRYARKLKAVGVPEEQAEVQGEAMAEAFGYYIGNLVTKDYLDARFAQQDAKLDKQFAEIRAQLRMHNWIFAMLAAAVLLPAIKEMVIP
ncbi:hypothetical protein FV139_04310 [Parahaliea maris]|uniref:DUF1640 domain-containing protein n=1 Tax=Parahaliea maris TaxID=2716870 RepID=A0A5C9A7I1_9GAMM|nr:hypothetical protein [Parahaliea maris]TXS96698.1 hypothetical protein FV139_04310 [Parahaliea maris]